MTPLLGIDASKYQGEHGMSFQRFKALIAAGVKFAIFRATIGAGVDASCATNLKRAKKLGLVTGTYHFLLPGNGAAQAELYAKHCGDGIAVLDVEQAGVTLSNVRAFVRRFRELKPKRPLGCYTSKGAWGKLTGNADGADMFDFLWNAYWTQLGTNEVSDLPAEAPRAGYGGWRAAPLWQYGAFRVKGYPIIDGNAFYGTLAELRALGNEGLPWTPIPERLNYRRGYTDRVDLIVSAISTMSPGEMPGQPAYRAGQVQALADAADATNELRLREP